MAFSGHQLLVEEEMMQCPYCKEEVLDGAIKCKHCGSSLVLTPQARDSATSDFGAIFSSAMELWKNNLADLAVVTLVFMLVGWIPIINIAFIAGYVRCLTKVARGQGKAAVGDIFSAWDCFANLLVYLLIYVVISFILNFIPIVGALASLALGFLAAPGVFAIIDNKMGAIDALKWGVETIQADLTNWLLAYLVGGVVCFVGFLVLIIGAILTMPLGQLIIIKQYERCRPA